MDFDYVKKADGVRFIQFGRKKIRWIMFKKKKTKCPTFISTYGWTVSFAKFGFMFGNTKKPLKFEKQWGVKYVEALRNEGSGKGVESPLRLVSK